MFEFLGNALFQVIVQPENTEEVEVTKKQPKKRKLKDLSSTAGSQTVDNIVKPVGKHFICILFIFKYTKCCLKWF